MARRAKSNKFSLEEEEQIIEFVQKNEILYNVHHMQFRDAEKKNRLWLQLADEELHRKADGKCCFVWSIEHVFLPMYRADSVEIVLQMLAHG